MPKEPKPQWIGSKKVRFNLILQKFYGVSSNCFHSCTGFANFASYENC
ncbi:MAG: hypothetical protein RLZZ519_72 [Bacteroidota bacterium]|jgi:hypothetical protein